MSDENLKITGSYTINNQETKSFEIEYELSPEKEAKTNQLMELLDKPWKLIKQGGNYGVRGVKRFFTIILSFMFCNILLFFYSLIKAFSSGFEFGKLGFVFLILIFGIAATIFAGYKTYQFIVLDTMRVIYENMSSLFKKMSDALIDKSEEFLKDKLEVKNEQLQKTLDISKIITEKYDAVPSILKKGIFMVMEKIPVVGMITDLREDILEGKKDEASSKLYQKMNAFISDSIFSKNNTNWVFWMLPANIIIVLLIVAFKIS